MHPPISIVVVEDNAVYRDALELVLGLRDDVEVVASVADGDRAAATCERLRPDICLMDYRLPGIDGVEATRAVLAASPDTAVICLTAAADERERDALAAAGAVATLSKDEEFESVVAAILRAARPPGRRMNLTAANTAIVLDSTSDFPGAAERLPNWRVVPLYVRFGDETFRDYVELSPEGFYERLRTAPGLPASSQPTPVDFDRAYAELTGYERILSVHIAGRLSGTVESARVAAAEHPTVRVIDSGTASAAIAMQALGIQRLLEAGTTDDAVDAFVERFKREVGLLFTVDTLEFLARGGRIGRAKAAAGSLLQVKPILTIADGEVVPVGRAHGSRKALAELAAEFERRTDEGSAPHVGMAHADAPERMAALRDLVLRARPDSVIELETTLGAVVGTHAGPGTVGLFWFAEGSGSLDS